MSDCSLALLGLLCWLHYLWLSLTFCCSINQLYYSLLSVEQAFHSALNVSYCQSRSLGFRPPRPRHIDGVLAPLNSRKILTSKKKFVTLSIQLAFAHKCVIKQVLLTVFVCFFFVCFFATLTLNPILAPLHLGAQGGLPCPLSHGSGYCK